MPFGLLLEKMRMILSVHPISPDVPEGGRLGQVNTDRGVAVSQF